MGFEARKDRRPQGRKKLHAEREEYFRLVQQGYSSAEAAKRVGVHPRTARGWRNGRLLNSGRVEPPVRSQRAAVPVSSGRYLGEHERIHIADRLREKASIRTIAAELGRSPSTISREIRRNGALWRGTEWTYRPYVAQSRADARRPRPKPGKIGQCPRLRDYRPRRSLRRLHGTPGTYLAVPGPCLRELADHLADTTSTPMEGGGDRIGRVRGLPWTRMWDALVGLMKDAYTAGLGEGTVPRPIIMPLVRGGLVGLIWVRPIKVGQDALVGIAELANIAAAAGADEVVLAWETHDVATACELPVVGPAPCLNMVLATPAGHVLRQFPHDEQLSSRSPEGWASIAPGWRPAPAPQPGGELVPPIQAAVNFSFAPIELDHPDPFGVTVVLMEEDGYRISPTEAFGR